MKGSRPIPLVRLFGIGLELRLEGGKLGKRRVRVNLLFALTMWGVVATVLVLISRFREMRSLTPGPFRAITLPFGTMFGAIFLPPLAAVIALSGEFALQAMRTTMRHSLGFAGRVRGGDRFAFALRGDGASARCIGDRHATMALACALPLRRAPLATPLFAAPAWAPHFNKFRLRRNEFGLRRRRRLRRPAVDGGSSRRGNRSIEGAPVRRNSSLVGR